MYLKSERNLNRRKNISNSNIFIGNLLFKLSFINIAYIHCGQSLNGICSLFESESEAVAFFKRDRVAEIFGDFESWKQLLKLLFVLNYFSIKICAKNWPKCWMSSHLAQRGQRLIHRMSRVRFLLNRDILTPPARPNLPEQRMANSEFLHFFFTIWLVLIYNHIRSKKIRIGINLREHFLIILVFFLNNFMKIIA